MLGRERQGGLESAERLVAYCVALLSIGAGVIHISAAADHTNLPVMMVGFLCVATVQVGLGGLLLWRRPSRLVLYGALLTMVGSLSVWFVSRTLGLPFLPGGHMEPIGFKDGVTVIFELAAVPGLLLLMSREVDAISLPSPRLATNTLAGVEAGMFMLFVPALVMAGGEHHSAEQMAHSHGEQAAADGGHAHGEEGAGGGGAGGDGHAHGSGGDEQAGDGHGSDGHGSEDDGHDHGDPKLELAQTPSGAHAHDDSGGTAGVQMDGGAGGGHEHGTGGHGGSGGGDGGSGDGHQHGGDGGSDQGGSGHGHGDGGHGGGHGGSGEGGSGDREGHGDGEGGSGHGHGGGGGGHGGSGEGGSGGGQGHGDGEGGSGHGHGGGGGEGGSGEGGSGDGHGHGGGGGEGHGDGGDGHGEGGHGGSGDGGYGSGHGEPEPVAPPIPGAITSRLTAIQPKPAGTRETVRLQYGPFVVPPGNDATQVFAEVGATDGFVVAAKPNLRYSDGTALDHDDKVHMHHAHLFRRDGRAEDASDGRPGYEWLYGTGDEATEGSFEHIGDADPRGRRWGVQVHRGEPLALIWMPHNMTMEEKVVWLEFEFEFVHGTADQIEQETGRRYRPLSPVLHGSTFNVPKAGGEWSWPLDAKPGSDSLKTDRLSHEHFLTEHGSSVVPGVGHIWTAPSDGEMIGAAGHMHEGGTKVVFSNLGSESAPCPDDGDRYPGTTILESSAYTPKGVFPSHLKMGTSQVGWRVRFQKGDRIAINGVYDTTSFAYPDQMSVVGIYYDADVDVTDAEPCAAALVNEPDATREEAIASVPTQTSPRGDDGSELFHHSGDRCVADGCNDYDAPPLPRGPQTTTIFAENFQFTPGDLTASRWGNLIGSSLSGAPSLRRGERLRFVNLDFVAKGGARHSIASCSGPCNGPWTMSYPHSDGRFYSGPMGYVPLAETASNENQATPTWELDTTALERGYHTFYCRNHPWMRGAFYLD